MKGNVEDIVVIAIVAIALGVVAMLCYVILQAYSTSAPIMAEPLAAYNVAQGMAALALMGNSVIFITMALGIASIISAFYTDSHPVFFVFSLMSFSICIMLISIFSQVFIEISNASAFVPVVGQFYTMIETIRNFPIVGVMLGSLIVIALYIKRHDLGGGTA